MKVERTFDAEIIKRCVTHPSVWPQVHDDMGCSREDYTPITIPEIYWIMVKDETPKGVFLLHPHNGVCYEVHTCLLPEVWGKTTECTALAMAWIFENTPCQRLITNVPAYNKLALRLAERTGMKRFGINEKSYLKNGILHDQFMLGISKKETSCQQQSQ